MTDKRYFKTHTKGEVAEYKHDLNSTDKSKQKDALKKVIAAMTVGKDVSMLFPDVTRCMQTDDLELKKLVYLYLINYAKSQPEMAILAVNTFVKDSMDTNPLIRALAVRTMGCIRVDKITEYLCDPLEKALKDQDPYVRKTAAIAVAKLYDMNPELVEDRGFLETLKDMTADAVPMVVSNAVAALQEISELSGKELFVFSKASMSYFVNALDQCTEWGQVYLLECLAAQEPATAEEAENIITRVLTRLQHANSAVVLAAVKVVLSYMNVVKDTAITDVWLKKMAPALVTLLSAEPEIQYVALRNINLILQQYPQILAHEVKVFFCKYNDPIYVKLEKLDIMVRLANPKNVEQVLAELKEYAQEVDVDFVRKAVSCIGQCAIRLDEASQRCITTLLELIKMKVSYVVQEAVIVIKDIFRRYPNRYEAIITDLCESLEVLEEPEAKAGMMWIIGEYADRIENADELLSYFLDSFPDEPPNVQLQLLTATVKLFLKKPTEVPQHMISQVLTCATLETDNPDLRDRAYMYWRMLSNMPQEAAAVVLAEKPMIEDASNGLDPELLSQLLKQLSSLSSVFHTLPSSFVKRQRLEVQTAAELEEKRLASEIDTAADHTPSTATVLPTSPPSAFSPDVSETLPPAEAPAPAPQGDLLGDLLGGDVEDTPTDSTFAAPAAVNGVDDLLSDLDLGQTPTVYTPPAATATDPFGLDMLGSNGSRAEGTAAPRQAAAVPDLPLLCAAESGAGCEVRGVLVVVGGRPVYKLQLTNRSTAMMNGFMIQFNKNLLGLAPIVPAVEMADLQPGESVHTHVNLHTTPDKLNEAAESCSIAIALKFAQAPVFYLADAITMEQVAIPEGKIEAGLFLKDWSALQTSAGHSLNLILPESSVVQSKLESCNCFMLAVRPVPGTNQQAMYVTCRPVLGPQVLLELKFCPGVAPVGVTVKSESPSLGLLVTDMLLKMFSA